MVIIVCGGMLIEGDKLLEEATVGGMKGGGGTEVGGGGMEPLVEGGCC